jgi:hypothetical protein
VEEESEGEESEGVEELVRLGVHDGPQERRAVEAAAAAAAAAAAVVVVVVALHLRRGG